MGGHESTQTLDLPSIWDPKNERQMGSGCQMFDLLKGLKNLNHLQRVRFVCPASEYKRPYAGTEKSSPKMGLPFDVVILSN